MAKLPRISGKEAVAKFGRAGWSVARQKGSHVMMTRQGSIVTLSIPQHPELDSGLLRGLIRIAGLSVDEFIAL